MDIGVIYYTDNRLPHRLNELVRYYIRKSLLPITSCTLEPTIFGTNIVLRRDRSVVSMFEQIKTALEFSMEKYVFFCEHDVLYHHTHFNFIPTKDDVFFYNNNVWRCNPRLDIAVTYDDLSSLSGLCVNRELALDHFTKRLEYIYEQGYDKVTDKNPAWARMMGYEPGPKSRKGRYGDDKAKSWRSQCPNVDIRHGDNLTISKLSLRHFNRPPKNWVQTTIEQVPCWNLRGLF